MSKQTTLACVLRITFSVGLPTILTSFQTAVFSGASVASNSKNPTFATLLFLMVGN